MKRFLRELAISVAPKVLPSTVQIEKLLAISLLTREQKAIFATPRFPTREALWEAELSHYKHEAVKLIEFGVWKGESLKHFSSFLESEGANFVGFDSFDGLPETWNTLSGKMPHGTFAVGGNAPDNSDPRVTFVKGWFQDTVLHYVSSLLADKAGFGNYPLIVHYDADLYSSTLFCLMQIDRLKEPYLAFFDEFPGHESRALFNYQQATGAELKFLGRVGPTPRYPCQVAVKITPDTNYGKVSEY